jgi:hypothetical protein
MSANASASLDPIAQKAAARLENERGRALRPEEIQAFRAKWDATPADSQDERYANYLMESVFGAVESPAEAATYAESVGAQKENNKLWGVIFIVAPFVLVGLIFFTSWLSHDFDSPWTIAAPLETIQRSMTSGHRIWHSPGLWLLVLSVASVGWGFHLLSDPEDSSGDGAQP